jgi:hypothetical protein
LTPGVEILRFQLRLCLHLESQRQQFREGHCAYSAFGREENWRFGLGELGQNLTAGAAGRAGSLVQIGDRDGFDANIGSELGNGPDQGGTLGADGQPVTHIFDVGSSDDLSVGEQEGGAYAEAGIGRVGVKSRLMRLFEEADEWARWMN